MAINEFTGAKNEKWGTVENWSLGHKPKIEEDAYIPKGKKCELNTAGECRSLYVNEAELKGASALKIGTSSKPEGQAGNLWALKITAGSTIAYTGEITLESTFSTEAQKISINKSLTLKSIIRGVSGSIPHAKYRLEEGLVSNKSILASGELALETNGFKLECTELSFATGSTLVGGASEIVASGSIKLQSGSSVAETKFVQTGGAECGLTGNTLAALTIEANGITISSSNTIGTLTINGGTIGVKFTKGTTQTIEHFATNAKAGAEKILQSSEAGKEWKLHKASGNVNTDYLELIDSHVDASPKWYAGTHSVNNETGSGNANWKFEAEPSGEVLTFAATATIGVKPTAGGKMIAATAATARAGVTATTQDRMIAATAAKVAVSLSPKLTDQLLASFGAATTTSISPNLSSKLAAAFAAHTGVTVQPGAQFRLVTTETGKKLLFVVMEE